MASICQVSIRKIYAHVRPRIPEVTHQRDENRVRAIPMPERTSWWKFLFILCLFLRLCDFRCWFLCNRGIFKGDGDHAALQSWSQDGVGWEGDKGENGLEQRAVVSHLVTWPRLAQSPYIIWLRKHWCRFGDGFTVGVYEHHSGHLVFSMIKKTKTWLPHTALETHDNLSSICLQQYIDFFSISNKMKIRYCEL